MLYIFCLPIRNKLVILINTLLLSITFTYALHKTKSLCNEKKCKSKQCKVEITKFRWSIIAPFCILRRILANTNTHMLWLRHEGAERRVRFALTATLYANSSYFQHFIFNESFLNGKIIITLKRQNERFF